METLERHVQEHQQFQDMVTDLNTELKTVSEKLADGASPTVEQPSTEQKELKSQVCYRFCIMEKVSPSPGCL